MRNFNIMAAVAVALLAGGVAAADEKPAKAKEKKICRVEEDSGSRFAARRVCTTIVERQQPTRGEPQQAAAKPAGATSPSN